MAMTPPSARLRTALATSDGVAIPSRHATAPARFFGPCMHEAIFSDKGFAGGLTTQMVKHGSANPIVHHKWASQGLPAARAIT